MGDDNVLNVENKMFYETVMESSQEEVLKNYNTSDNQKIKGIYSRLNEYFRIDVIDENLFDNDAIFNIGEIFTSKSPENIKDSDNSGSDDILSTASSDKNELSLLYDNNTLFEKYNTEMYDSTDKDLFLNEADDVEDKNGLCSLNELDSISSEEEICLDVDSPTSDSDSDDENHTVRYYSSFMHSFYDDTKSDSILNQETSLIEKEEIDSTDCTNEKTVEILPKKIINTNIIYTKDTIKHIKDYLITKAEFSRIKRIQKDNPLFEAYDPKATNYVYCTINELLCLEKPLGFSPRIYLMGLYLKNENGEHILYDKQFKTNIKLMFHKRETVPILGTNILTYGILHFNKNYIGVKVHFWTLLCISTMKKTHERFLEDREKIKKESKIKCLKCQTII